MKIRPQNEGRSIVNYKIFEKAANLGPYLDILYDVASAHVDTLEN